MGGVEAQGKLKKGPARGLAICLFVGFGAHETADNGDVGVCLVVGQFFLTLHEGVVIGVDPSLGGFCRYKLKAERPHASAPRHLDGVDLGAGYPERRMGLLVRLRQNVSEGKVEELPVVFPGFGREHGNNCPNRIFPDGAFVPEPAIKGVQFGDGGALTDSEFNSAVTDQVEGGHALGHARGVVRGELDDAVGQTDLLGPLTGRRKKNLRGGGMGILLEKMVLHLPGVVVAEAVGEFDLIK